MDIQHDIEDVNKIRKFKDDRTRRHQEVDIQNF